MNARKHADDCNRWIQSFSILCYSCRPSYPSICTEQGSALFVPYCILFIGNENFYEYQSQSTNLFFFFCLKLFSPFCDVLKQRNTTATPSNPHPTQTLKKQKEMSQSMKVELLELNVVLGFFFFFLNISVAPDMFDF